MALADVNGRAPRRKTTVGVDEAEVGKPIVDGTGIVVPGGSPFEQLLEFAPDAIVGISVEGIVVLVNQQAEVLFGHARDELLGGSVESFVPGWFDDADSERRTGSFADPSTRPIGLVSDLRGRRRDGSEFPAELSFSSIEVDGERLAVAAVRDVTERRDAEQDRSRLAAIVDASDDAIIGYSPSGEITSWNLGAQKLFEREADDAIGQPIAVLGAHEHPSSVATLLSHSGPIERVEHHEAQHRRADGTTVDVGLTLSPIRGEDGEVTGVATIARDITARKRAQRMFEQLLEFAPDAIVGISAEGLVALVNQQAEVLFGYTRERLLGKSIEALIPGWFDDAHSERRTGPFADPSTRPMSVAVDLHGRRRDGSEFPAEISLSSIETEDGIIATAAVRDISDRAESDRERALAEELDQTRRLESVGQLAGGIAHDFNNLLGVIINYATFVADALPEGERAHEDLEEIRSAAQRGAKLTRQLLIFSRREVVKQEILDLNGIVSGIDNLLRRALGERVELEVRLAAELWPIEADQGQIEQILVNLAVNARDAMPDGGRLLVETSNSMVDESIASSHVDVRPGRYVRLTVRDFGTGMEEEVRQRAFEPFFTTKSKAEGTGLGLATVYGIVTQSGGRIELDSELGSGTIVTVDLPASSQVPRPSRADVAVGSRGHGETILVVEDEREVRKMTQRILTDAGYVALGAAGGAEGIALTATSSIDLLLTDLIMPGMLGTELVERMRVARPDLKVVIMSGYSHSMLAHETISESPNTAFIEKPFTANELQETVRDLLEATEG